VTGVQTCALPISPYEQKERAMIFCISRRMWLIVLASQRENIKLSGEDWTWLWMHWLWFAVDLSIGDPARSSVQSVLLLIFAWRLLLCEKSKSWNAVQESKREQMHIFKDLLKLGFWTQRNYSRWPSIDKRYIPICQISGLLSEHKTLSEHRLNPLLSLCRR
jgi:hypothetical protein